MKLTVYSHNKFYKTFSHWRVDKEYADTMFNYLVYSYNPGSFFTSVLANDFADAVARSHPSNTIPALKNLTGWIRDHVPPPARGSYQAVKIWEQVSDAHRRVMLEDMRLIYTEEEEIMMTLRGDTTEETVLY